MKDPISHHRWRENRFVFFVMLLFATICGLFAALAYREETFLTALLLSATGIVTFVGVALQAMRGLTAGIRFFYGACGIIVFVYLVLAGGHQAGGLFGALALTPGFVAVLGWRYGGLALLALTILTTTVFYVDAGMGLSQELPVATEIRFLMTFCSLTLLSLGAGYTWQSSVSDLLQANLEISALAYRDPLTGLANRRAVEDLVGQRWEEYKRGGQGFAILLCNIDHLKRLNDRFGREFGDSVLIRVANAINRGLRSQDVSARWEGDVFLVLLPGESHLSALKVGERLRRRVTSIKMAMYSEPVKVTLSIGVAGVENALSADDLVSVADAGLYQAKHMGRDRVQLG